MNAPLVLKDFSGVPEITPDAYELKRAAIEAARPVARVENPEQQLVAVAALAKLREVLKGMESTRKTVKAPVLDLGRKIDKIAHDFTEDLERQAGRISGMINHYQRKQAREQAEKTHEIEREVATAAELREKAAVLSASGKSEEAGKLEAQAFDLEMKSEVTLVPVIEKPQGLVVRNRINFQVLDPIVFAQAWPSYWKWHEDTETLKLDRMKVLDALNAPASNSDFHRTRFPEELSQTADRRLVQPAGLRVYEETKAHIR